MQINIQEFIELIGKGIIAYLVINIIITISIIWYIITLKKDIANTQVNTNNIEIDTNMIADSQAQILKNQEIIIENQIKLIKIEEMKL